MNEQALHNIWNKLKSEGKTDSDFSTWKSIFLSNEGVQNNVHRYLSKTNATKNDLPTWKNNVIGGKVKLGEKESVETDEEGTKKYRIGQKIKVGDYEPFEGMDGNLIFDQDLTITGLNEDGNVDVQLPNGMVQTISQKDLGQEIVDPGEVSEMYQTGDDERKLRYNHPKFSEFLEKSKARWGTIGVTPVKIPDREDIIVPFLQEKYTKDKYGNDSGITFEKSGIGNNVEITLPGSELSRTFPLYHGSDPAKVKEQFMNIVEYIESTERKAFKDPIVEEKFRNIFKSREVQYGGPSYDERLVMNPNIKDDSTNPFWKDQEIASDINLLLGDSGITAKETKWFQNAVTLSNEHGTEQTFNLNNPKAVDMMLHFIKSDRRNVKQTKDYQLEVEELRDEADNFLQPYIDNPGKLGLQIYLPKHRGELKKRIKAHLGLGWERHFGKERLLSTMTKDEQDRIVDSLIEETLQTAKQTITEKNMKKEYGDLVATGLDHQAIGESIEKKMLNTFTDLQQKKANNLLAIEKERQGDNDTNKIETYQNNILSIDKLRKEAGEKFTYFLDPETLERKYSLVTEDDKKIRDLTEAVNQKTEEIAKKNLTREDLRKGWMHKHLASDEAMDKWRTQKRIFYLDPEWAEAFSKNHKDITVHLDRRAPGGRPIGGVQYEGNPYIRITDEQRGRMLGSYFNSKNSLIGPEGQVIDLNDLRNRRDARMQYIIDVRTEAEAYNKLYGLNEGIIGTEKGTGLLSKSNWKTFGEGVVKSFASQKYEFEHGRGDAAFRNTMLDTYYELGVDPTQEEKEYAKLSSGETTAEAVATMPKLIAEFAIANKITAGFSFLAGIDKIMKGSSGFGGLTGQHFLINGKKLTRGGLYKHIVSSAPKSRLAQGIAKGSPSFKPGVAAFDDAIGKWIKTNVPKSAIVKPSLQSTLTAVAIRSGLEGVKMEIAMNAGLLGKDPTEYMGWGSSFATGVGFGMLQGIVPWQKLFTRADGTIIQNGWKGLYDYAVVAPVNFTAAAQMGKLTNAIAADFMGTGTWNNIMEDEFGDYDSLKKHLISDLVLGAAMRLSHFNKFDFKSAGRIRELQKEAQRKYEDLYELHKKDNPVTGEKKGDPIIETRTKEVTSINKDGTTSTKQVTEKVPKLKKGKTQEDVDKQTFIIGLTTNRLALINNTREYMDPILGPVRLMRDFEATLKETGDFENTKFHYDRSLQKNMTFKVVESGKLLRNGKINESGKEVVELVFNPTKVNPGLAPHELGHYGFNKISKDAALKGKYVTSLIDIAKKINFNNKQSLYQRLVEIGVWKTDRSKYDMIKLKEWELFSHIAEFLTKNPEDLRAIRKSHGFDRLAGWIESITRKKLKHETNLNTEKEVIQWFDNYIETIGKGKSVKRNLKDLEKFMSRTRTENQRKRRKQHEDTFGKGDVWKERVEDIKIEKIQLQKEWKADNLLKKLEDNEITEEEYKSKAREYNTRIKEINEIIKWVDNVLPKEMLYSESLERSFTEKESDSWTKDIQKEWDNRKNKDFEITLMGSKIKNPSKSDMAFYLADKYNPLRHTNPGSMAVARAIEKFNTPRRSSFTTMKDKILDDLTFGGGSKGRKEGSIRDEIMKYDPTGEHKGVPLTAYIGSVFFKGRRGVKEVVDRYAPETGMRVVTETGIEGMKGETGSFENTGRDKGRINSGDMATITIENFKANRPDKRLTHEMDMSVELHDAWRQNVVKGLPKVKAEDVVGKHPMSFRSSIDLAPKQTQKFFNMKYGETEKKNSNDLHKNNFDRFQETLNGTYEKVKEGKTFDEFGNRKDIIERKNVVDAVRLQMPVGTVTTEGVTKGIEGRSVFDRLSPATLGKLYHRATPENYTRAELLELGFKTLEKPHAKGYWRVATPAGGAIYLRGKEKGKELTNEDILEYAGIKNTYNKKGDVITTEYAKQSGNLNSSIRRLVDLFGKSVTRDFKIQETFRNPDRIPAEHLAHYLLNNTAGTSNLLASTTLQRLHAKNPKEALKIFDMVQQEPFSVILRDIMSLKGKDGQPRKNPLGEALVQYKQVTQKSLNVKIKDGELLKIGKELGKNLRFEGLTTENISTKIGSKIVYKNILDAIANEAGKIPKKAAYRYGTPEGIIANKRVSKLVAEAMMKKLGKEVYESIFLAGETSGTGVGMFKDGNIYGVEIGGNRFATYKTAAEARKAVEDVKTALKFDEITRADSDRQGKKRPLMKYINFLKGAESFDMKKAEEAFNHGETNKRILRKAVDVLKDLYDKEIIDHNQVQSWIETAGGPMEGIIRKSASLAILPKGTPKELFKIFGEDWVLEHTLPTQVIKSLIYKHVLSEGKSNIKRTKEDLDLALKDFHTTFIPKTLDDMVNVLYKDSMPSAWKPGMDPIIFRYYRNANPMDFNIALRNFAKNKNYDVNPTKKVSDTKITHDALKRLNVLLFPKWAQKVASGRLASENLESSKKIDDALSLGRKRIKERRGISVWDFDDTIARTKSGVLAKIPNPEYTPKPQRKVIFMAGGPGSGKSSVIKGLGLEKQGFKIVNQDISLQWLAKNHGLPKDMRDFTPEQRSKWSSLQWEARDIAQKKQMKFQGRGDGIIVDGTGQSAGSMMAQRMAFQRKGYDVSMLYVETSLETALARNKARKERSLTDKIVERTWKNVDFNKRGYKRDFGENFIEVKTDNLKLGDAMPKEAVLKMNEFVKGYEKRRLTAEEFAHKGKEILDKGGEFDFSEFEMVREGEPGPFFDKFVKRMKKYGPKDNFILTARPKESAEHIHMWLKMEGYEIPLENIKALGNSTAEAKALWILEKFGEGYNDFYFADDAIANVKEVKNVLSQLDVKSKVQQALASENLNRDFNKIIEESTGFKAEYTVSGTKAELLGKKKGTKSIIVPGAQDFMGMMQNFMGKGKQGDAHRKWFEDKLVKPFARGTNELNHVKQRISEDFKNLAKELPTVKKNLNKKIPGSVYTYDQAIRVHRWTEDGHVVPEMSKADLKKLNDVVNKDAELKTFSDKLSVVARGEYAQPTEYWVAETILSDFQRMTQNVGRKKYLSEWIENKNIIFSKENLNKIEATQGKNFREALEDILYRMETGSNRPRGNNKLANAHMNFINGSVGATMFLNMRSALLQTLSTVNYINWGDNNPIKAATAFGNQPQYWKDFSMIWNSPMLRQRRKGLQYNVQEAELAAAVSGSKNKAKKAIAWLLKKGFTPTQIADSFAISAGGATMYRNRYNSYKKQGLSDKMAREKAWIDFQETTEKAQQSSRADLISQQQASVLGRTILAWANTPMQYMRIQEKAARDIINGRGDFKTNMSKIVYYGTIQSLIFASLQSALFAFGLDEDDEKDLDNEELRGRLWRVVNTVADSQLRGIGTPGALLSAIKNTALEFDKQEQKGYRADHTRTILQLTSYSPVIGSKLRKLYSAAQSYKYNRETISDMGLNIDNPAILATANTIEATTNIPTARTVMKVNNLREAADDRNQWWQRVASLFGYARWDIGAESEELEEAKERVKKQKKKTSTTRKKTRIQDEDQAKIDKAVIKEKILEKQGKLKTFKCSAAKSGGGRCGMTVNKAGAKCTIHEKVKQRKDGKKVKCKAIKKNGKPCGMTTSNASGLCYHHD